MIPLHRECPPHENKGNFNKVRKMRFVMTAAVFSLQFFTAFTGVWLVEFLYDDRFLAAGSVVVAVACMNVPYLIGMTYDFSALGRGDSRGYFLLRFAQAVSLIIFFILGMEYFGLLGALIGVWLSQILVYPLVVNLAHKHGAWDPWHDLFYTVIAALLTTGVLWYHIDDLAVLSTF